MKDLILQNKKECFVCHTIYNLHLHHIIFGKNRKKCDEDKLMIYLCKDHHEGTYGVHGKKGHNLDLELKRMAQRKYEETHTRDEFIKRYKKSYL